MNAAALNGARGTAVDFGFGERITTATQDGWVPDSGRYRVKLDGEEGRLVKVKAVNVEGEDGARFGAEGIGPPGMEGIHDPQQAPGRDTSGGVTMYANVDSSGRLKPSGNPPPTAPGGYKWS